MVTQNPELVSFTDTKKNNQAPLQPVQQGPEPVKPQQKQQGVGLQPVTATPSKPQLNLDQFVEHSRKLAERRANLQAQKLREGAFRNQAQDIARQVYGQGVGATSGIGQQVVGQGIERFGQALEPIVQDVALQTAQSELDAKREMEADQLAQQRKQADEAFALVQSGQLTGPQAESVLRQRGINPETYMTPEQLASKQEKEAFQTRIAEVVKDPEIAQLIDSQEELDFYLDNGMTYEEEVADIFEKSETLNEWKSAKPQLQNALRLVNERLKSEQKNLFQDDQLKERYKKQIAALQSAINRIDANQIPEMSTDVEEAKTRGDVSAR